MTTPPLIIAVAQAKFATADLVVNQQKIISIAKIAHDKGADLLLLPKLALCGVALQGLAERDAFLLEQQEVLIELAQALLQFEGLQVVVGHLTVGDGQVYDSVSLLNDGKVTQTQYLKSSTDELSFEQAVFEIKGHRFAFLMGDDNYSSNNVFEELEKREVKSLLLADATPYYVGRMVKYQNCLIEQLQAYQFNVFYSNHVGGHDQLIYEGRSFLLNKNRELQVELNCFVEALATYQLNDDNNWSCLAIDSLVEKTTDAKANLTYNTDDAIEAEIWRALVLSTQDFLRHSGINKVILGLSGGMDSALVLAILYDAIGSKSISAAMLSSPYTSQLSLDLAEDMAARLNVTYYQIDIQPMFDAYMTGLGPIFGDLPADTTEENLQARIRGVLLMALSNKLGGMVICSSNKSEAATGYSTLYGDTVGGFAILKDVPKTLVYRLAKWRNSQQEIIPVGIITRPPSAELADEQVDQDSLPEYDILDDILFRLIELKQSSAEIIQAGHEPATVDKISRLLKFNEYKRFQTAPGPRISQGAFGLDWQCPLSHGFRF